MSRAQSFHCPQANLFMLTIGNVNRELQSLWVSIALRQISSC